MTEDELTARIAELEAEVAALKAKHEPPQPEPIPYPRWIRKYIYNDWGQKAVVDARIVNSKEEHDAAGDGWE